VTVDRVTNDGLAVGDVVIAAGGALAGRVTDASPGTAHVTLINDPTSTVTGMVDTSRATGDVSGQLGGVLSMENIQTTERENIAHQIVNAGIEAGTASARHIEGAAHRPGRRRQRDANIVQTAFLSRRPISTRSSTSSSSPTVSGLPTPSPSPGESTGREFSRTMKGMSSPAGRRPPVPTDDRHEQAPAADHDRPMFDTRSRRWPGWTSGRSSSSSAARRRRRRRAPR
jgi:hypothetical protein